ncbi:MAG TPA: PAS domain S-box protein [Gallionella sp.]|nr:PAS domain S-box protein [Gallionella sp.]
MKSAQTRFSEAWERLVTVKAGNEEEARLGRLFNTLMVISTGIVVALSTVFLLMQPLGLLGARVSWTAAAFPLAFVPLSIFCLVQARRGHIRPMVLIYSWVNLIAIGIAAWLFDGVYSPAWPLFIWTITVAGVLLAPAYALWMTGGVVSYFVLLLLATQWGSYTPLLTFGGGREFVHMSFLLIMLVSTVGLLTWLNMRSLRDALERLYKEIAVRKRTEEYLRQSEAQFRSIFENADDIIYTIEADGTFSSISPSCERMLGWRPEEWIGRPFPLIVHPDDLPYMQELFGKAQAEEPLPVFQVRILTKAGGYLESEIAANPIRRGDSVVILGVVRDITERKRIEEAIRKLNEELEIKVQERTRQLLEAQEELVRKEKLAVLGQVAGSVGHELRNPLGVMSNAVYFLRSRLADADQGVKDYLNIIENEIAGSERIVSDLLDSVRTKPPHPETVGARELIEQTLRRYAVPSTVGVNLDIPETLPPLQVDAMQIQQVLRNLVSNSVEAMPNGGTLDIRAMSDTASKTITVSVRDSGCGMAAEQLGKLFQPLFTTKARGIGLGLVVVKNLTEANGGRVEVQSEPGKGTEFRVILPAAQ